MILAFIYVLFASSLFIVAGFVRESFSIGQIFFNDLRAYLGLLPLLFFGLVGGGALFGVLVFYRRSLSRVFYFAVLILSPLGLMIMGQLIWGVAQASASASIDDPFAESSEPAEISIGESGSHRRVIWLVFDTLDPRAVFEERPNGWVYPAIDQFRAEAYYINNVDQTGPNTFLAIPSMLTGYQVLDAEILPDPDLLIQYGGSNGARRLSQMDTIFRQAHSLGIRSARVGFHHPYCRLFEGLLSKCLRLAVNSPEQFPRSNLLQVMWLQFRALSIFHRRHAAIDAYKILSERAHAIALDPNIDLAFVHMTMPHKPYIYDPEEQDFTLFNFDVTGYFDNIVLVDHFLAQLRSDLKDTGLWDETTIIVTADTSWVDSAQYYGDDLKKIPLLIKLHKQTNAVPLPQPFNGPLNGTIVHDLVLDLLVGKLTTYKDLEKWLVTRSSARSAG
jgi:hypothetical protein